MERCNPYEHVWETRWGSKISICIKCGADKPVAKLAPGDPLARKVEPELVGDQARVDDLVPLRPVPDATKD